MEIMGGETGTNADGIAVSRAGVHTAMVSIPLRYMHTPVEVIDVQDVEYTARLLAEYVKGWNEMADIELLERLCCARGISGFEEAVREIILKEIRPYADCVEITPLGNILAFKKGKRRAKTKLMLNAHMDEVGMTVTYIEENGLSASLRSAELTAGILWKPVTVGGTYPRRDRSKTDSPAHK